MSDSAEQVEQITKVPSVEGRAIAPKREKDPKRVAAGKKLAENNKRMREEYARYKAEESQRRNDESQRIHEAPETSEIETNETSLPDGFLSQLTLGNVLSLLGVGLSIYALFFKDKKSNYKSKDVDESWQEPVETTFERRVKQREEPKTEAKQKKKQETKARPKFGM